MYASYVYQMYVINCYFMIDVVIHMAGLRFTKNLKSDRNRKYISGAKMRFTKIIIL